jgi:hypothetical protein
MIYPTFSIKQQQSQSNLNANSGSSNPDSNVVNSYYNSADISPIAGNNINVSLTNDSDTIGHDIQSKQAKTSTVTTLLLILLLYVIIKIMMIIIYIC